MKYKNIENNFDRLLFEQLQDYRGPSEYLKAKKCLWFAVSDRADGYDVEEEWLGITKDGKLYWAYASGCSCWDGDYQSGEAMTEKTIKSFEFEHGTAPEDYIKALERYNETLEVQRI